MQNRRLSVLPGLGIHLKIRDAMFWRMVAVRAEVSTNCDRRSATLSQSENGRHQEQSVHHRGRIGALPKVTGQTQA
jgi:hypothetical protein